MSEMQIKRMGKLIFFSLALILSSGLAISKTSAKENTAQATSSTALKRYINDNSTTKRITFFCVATAATKRPFKHL